MTARMAYLIREAQRERAEHDLKAGTEGLQASATAFEQAGDKHIADDIRRTLDLLLGRIRAWY